MAEKEGQPLIKGGVPLFEWRPNASVQDFLEEDVESADEYENSAKDIFDPTERDDDVVEEANDHDDIETPNDDNFSDPDNNAVDDPAVFEPDLDDFGPCGLDPDADEEGAEANKIPETKIPETMLPTQTWSLTQMKIRVPIGTILGATEADPTVTDSITMTP